MISWGDKSIFLFQNFHTTYHSILKLNNFITVFYFKETDILPICE